MNYSIAQVRKAIAAAVIAAAGALVASSQKGTGLGTADYIAAVVVGLVAGIGVFLVPNAPVTPAASPPKTP